MAQTSEEPGLTCLHRQRHRLVRPHSEYEDLAIVITDSFAMPDSPLTHTVHSFIHTMEYVLVTMLNPQIIGLQ